MLKMKNMSGTQREKNSSKNFVVVGMLANLLTREEFEISQFHSGVEPPLQSPWVTWENGSGKKVRIARSDWNSVRHENQPKQKIQFQEIEMNREQEYSQ